MRRHIPILIFVVVFVFGFGYIASAQSGGLIPCGEAGNPCTTCHIFQLIKNVSDFIALKFTPVVGALMFVIAGFMLIIGSGNPKYFATGKSIFTNTIFAVVIIYGAWLITNFTMRSLAGASNIATSWYQLECSGGGGGSSSTGGNNTTGGGSTGGGGSSSTGGGTSGGGGSSGGGSGSSTTTLTENGARKVLSDNGVPVNKSACPLGTPYQEVSGGCTSLDGVKQSTVDGAIDFKEKCGCTVIVTGGTEIGHAAGVIGSHDSGDKLDFGRNSQIDSFIMNNFTFVGTRGDGAKLYKDPSTGAVYAAETDHWDVKGWDVDYS